MKNIRFTKKDGEIHVTNEDIEFAKVNEISLTDHLNNKYKEVVEMYNGEVDAFDIALLSHGIRVRGDNELGLSSSPMISFFTTNENKNLFPEFMIRTLRQISARPSIINALVASTQTIQGDSARQVYLDITDDKNKDAVRKRRIAEGADIPVESIKVGETTIKIYKYGIGVKTTYEALRRTTIDMFRKQMELVNLQASYDEVDTVVDIILNGDGVLGAANVFKASELPSGEYHTGDDEIKPITLLDFLLTSKYFNFDTIICGKKQYLQLVTTLMDKNLTSAVNPQVSFNFPQGLLSNINVIYYEDMPQTSGRKNQIIALAKNYAIQKTIEADSAINEVEKTSSNQTQTAYMTENAGFNKIDVRASAVLELD